MNENSPYRGAIPIWHLSYSFRVSTFLDVGLLKISCCLLLTRFSSVLQWNTIDLLDFICKLPISRFTHTFEGWFLDSTMIFRRNTISSDNNYNTNYKFTPLKSLNLLKWVICIRGLVGLKDTQFHLHLSKESLVSSECSEKTK